MRDFIRCFMIGPFVSFLLFAGLILSSPVVAAASEDELEAWTFHSCAEGWKEVWKDARKGNAAAFARLWTFVGLGDLVPPSYFPVSEDILPRYKIDNLMALAMYGRKGKMISKEILPGFALLPDELVGKYTEPDVRDKIQSVNRCFKRKRSVDVCYAMAVKLKLIPSFEQYVTFMDNAPRPAFCVPYFKPRSGPPTDLDLGPPTSGARSVPLKQ